MINLFIDSNIWLSLYHFSNNDINEFTKIKELINNDINLILPSQVIDEIYRNRDSKISDTIEKFDNIKIQCPAFCNGYGEFYETFLVKKSEFTNAHRKVIDEIKKDIENKTLPADIILNEIFSKVKILECNSNIVNKAVLRYNKGNPPGKDNKYGDAINWECILANSPKNEDLFFISNDKDYKSAFNEKMFNSFLIDEWKKQQNSNINYYQNLPDFLRSYNNDIELKDENYKENLIASLISSPNFEKTHSIIYQLSRYDNFSDIQIENICKAAYSNNQVEWILGDYDVNSFYKNLILGNAIHDKGYYTKLMMEKYSVPYNS